MMNSDIQGRQRQLVTLYLHTSYTTIYPSCDPRGWRGIRRNFSGVRACRSILVFSSSDKVSTLHHAIIQNFHHICISSIISMLSSAVKQLLLTIP